MKILHLTLHKRWFDDIAAEIKKIEYREVKPYWTKRLVGKEYDEIHFRNGYAKDAPFMRVEYVRLEEGHCFDGKDCYGIILGKVLEVRR